MLVFLILLGIYSIFFIIALIHLNIYISNVYLSVHFRSLEHLIVSNQHWTQNLCLDFQLSMFIYGQYSLKYMSYMLRNSYSNPLPINYWGKFPTQKNSLKQYTYVDFFVSHKRNGLICIVFCV